MNAEVKKKWIDALRSGRYLQGRGQLRYRPTYSAGPDQYCCLGVLCDLHSQETGTPWLASGGVAQYLNRSGILPDEVYRWAFTGGRPVNSHVGVLMGMNDGNPANPTPASFAQIADYIEANL